MTYAEALTHLFGQTSYAHHKANVADRDPTIDRMGPLMQALGHPYTRFRVVHIAGTKGKGSTSALCESMLHRLGYRTGLFTSPHLHTFRERIRVDQALIPAQDLADLMQRLHPIFKELPNLTVFDRITALAFQYFAERQVEWAVVEVGLGGRLDSTNVVQPQVCGITSISYDHMDILGNTLGQIAWEKAGILKPGAPAFTCAQDPEALAAIQSVAQARGVPLTVTLPKALPPRNLAGEHQRINAGLAQAMIENLAQRGLVRADPAALEQGIAETRWPGRFERLPAPPDPAAPAAFIVDCAHNLDSVERLLQTLGEEYPQWPVVAILGAGRTKQVQPMLGALLGHVSHLILVRSRHPVALPVQDLMALAQTLVRTRAAHNGGGRRPVQLHAAASMADALDLAARHIPHPGVVVGTGSVFVAAELREAWAARYPGLFDPGDWVFQAILEPAY